MLEGIHWLGHASFRIELGGMVVYIDPWKLQHPVPADLVLVTHEHHDHLSVLDIQKTLKPTTRVILAGKNPPELKGYSQVVTPGEKITVGAALVETVPAYNIGKDFHPRASNFVGFVLTLGGQRIYHAGDTDAIPEMRDLQCDVALLPIGGKYTMDAVEAAHALTMLKTSFAVPIHYGSVVGDQESARRFQQLAPKGVTVSVLEVE